jgi:hypothetical protein
MKTTFKTLMIGASMAVGMSAIAAPANAGSLTNAVITGTDIIKYKVNQSNQTVADSTASLSDILTGDSSSPTGNVELFASSERTPLSPTSTANATQRFVALGSFLGYNQVTSLSGEIGGKQITLSSLTASDWFGGSASSALQSLNSALTITNQTNRTIALNAAINPLYNSSNLATTWFNSALSTYNVTPTQALFNQFLLAGGFQRFSDPNISYVNQDDTTGQIKIGLAGHYDATALLGLRPDGTLRQASELVKVSYNNGPSQIRYNFTATQSGLVSNDGTNSHNGNYEVFVEGVAPQSQRVGNLQAVPEPSVMLGLLGVAGVFVTQRKSKKVSA